MALTTREETRKAWLESAITAIQDAQMGVISSGKTELSFNGRSVKNLSPSELEKMYRNFESELKKLERKEAGTSSRTIRFVG